MPEPQAKAFATRLRATRESQHLSQTDIAERSGLTPAAISQLESGDRLPAFKTLVTLADALKTSVGFLLGEESAELPPALKVFFRDLQHLDQSDVAKVRAYAAFLRTQGGSKANK